MPIRELTTFLLPPLIAGIIHHFVIIKYNLLPQLAVPIDHGMKLNNKPIFGHKKTYRGIIVMTLLTALFMPIISYQSDPLVKYDQFIGGALIGLCYSLGELPNSFLKRRLGIPESGTTYTTAGQIFRIIDHFDSVTAASLALFIVYQPALRLIMVIILTGATLHFLVDTILRSVGYKKTSRIPGRHTGRPLPH